MRFTGLSPDRPGPGEGEGARVASRRCRGPIAQAARRWICCARGVFYGQLIIVCAVSTLTPIMLEGTPCFQPPKDMICYAAHT